MYRYLAIEIYHLAIFFAVVILICNVKFRYDKTVMTVIAIGSLTLCFFNVKAILNSITHRASADMYAKEKELIIYSYSNLAEKLVITAIILILIIFLLFCFEHIAVVIAGYITLFYSPFILHTMAMMMDFTGKMSIWPNYLGPAADMTNSVILLFTIPLLWRKIILSYSIRKNDFKGV